MYEHIINCNVLLFDVLHFKLKRIITLFILIYNVILCCIDSDRNIKFYGGIIK